MKCILKRHDATFMRTDTIMCHLARQLQRRFVRLRPGVTEEHPVSEGGIDQLLRQPQDRFVGVAITGVP